MKLDLKKSPVVVIAAALALSSCGEDEQASTLPSPVAKSSLASLVLADPPSEAIAISTLRTTARPGDQVTFSGDVIGSTNVFMEGRAVVMLGDPEKITACNLRPDDPCETPWDVCCDDPEVIKASIVTVQALDEAGRPLKEGFKGLAGMKELSSVIVTGEVAESSNQDNLLVNATGIFVQK